MFSTAWYIGIIFGDYRKIAYGQPAPPPAKAVQMDLSEPVGGRRLICKALH